MDVYVDKLMIFKKILIISIIIATTGCSSDSIKTDSLKPDKSMLGVVFDSNPRGALIVCDGRSSGYTPATLSFTYTKEEKVSGQGFIPSCSLKWISGATVNIKETKIATTNYGLSFSATENGYKKGLDGVIQRPDITGYEKDAEFAFKTETAREQKRQADDMASIQAYSASIAMQSLINQQKYQSSTTNCYTNQYTGTTTCNKW